MDNPNSYNVQYEEKFNCANILTTYSCKYCDFLTHLQITLNNHIWRCHKSFHNYCKIDPKIGSHTCISCNFTSYSLLLLRVHEQKCAILNSFRVENKLKDNEIIRVSAVPRASIIYGCEYCNYRTKRKTEFKAHVKLHHKSDKMCASSGMESKRFFFCKLCGYKSHQRYRLKSHFVIRHTNPENRTKYKCHHCSFETVLKETLKAHVISRHTNPEETVWFKCELCKYKSNIKTNFQRHLKTHLKTQLPQLKYECGQCSYVTANKQCLKYHTVRSHTDPKEMKWFECDKCEYKAKIKYYLNSHIKNKHYREEERGWKCNLCPYKAFFKKDLVNHTFIHHRSDLNVICMGITEA